MTRPAARVVLILLAVALNGLIRTEQDTIPRFSSAALPASSTSAASSTVSAAPSFHEATINPDSPHPMSHVASITELPDGSLAATWYAGSREGAGDVAIYFSTRPPGDAAWSSPRAILTRQSAARELRRPIRKVGNAVIFSDEDGELWLLYVTVSVGGWSGSSLNLTRSTDRGETWTPSWRLTLNPFFNLAELVKNRPVPLTNGGWAVPIHHELVGRFSEVLWIRDDERGVRESKSRITGGRARVQPALIAVTPARGLAVLRDWSQTRQVSIARTDDAGRTWSSPQPVGLPNPDSGLDALLLNDRRLLLAFNDSTSGRENLRLAISSDEGATWTRVTTIAEETPGGEFSYPFLLQSRGGEIHLVYTWKRTAIRHVVFNAAWLDDRLGESSR
jgi:predicted neuraminidase